MKVCGKHLHDVCGGSVVDSASVACCSGEGGGREEGHGGHEDGCGSHVCEGFELLDGCSGL